MRKGEALIRDELAGVFGVHPDTVSAWTRKDGLAGAVAEWDTRGRPTRYDPVKARRWYAAYSCDRAGDRGCERCRGIVFGYRIVGKSLRERRLGCADPSAPFTDAKPCRG